MRFMAAIVLVILMGQVHGQQIVPLIAPGWPFYIPAPLPDWPMVCFDKTTRNKSAATSELLGTVHGIGLYIYRSNTSTYWSLVYDAPIFGLDYQCIITQGDDEPVPPAEPTPMPQKSQGAGPLRGV